MDYMLCYDKNKGFNNCIKSDRPTGYKHSEETILKLRECKIGDKNPMYGRKEDPEKTKIRMKNLHNTPKWNKGKTIKDDIRLEKLQYWKNKQTANSLSCTLVDNETGYKRQADSLKKLSEITPISLTTIQRLRNNTVGHKIKLKYKLQILW